MMPTVYEACAEAMGSYFKEGMKILDYGCGMGYFANYMNSQLKNFTYFGVEPDSSFGQRCISKDTRRNRRDGRMTFSFIGTPTEELAINESDIALLVSIFTHLDIDQTEEILSKLMPIIQRKGSIFFTMILGDEYKLGRGGRYSLSKTYSVVYNTKDQVEYLADKFNSSINLKGTWHHKHDWLHSIYEMRLPDAAD